MNEETKTSQVSAEPRATLVPIHGDWAQERSFGQQAADVPQKQYELCPPLIQGNHALIRSLID